jgi:hypothetical protein
MRTGRAGLAAWLVAKYGGGCKIQSRLQFLGDFLISRVYRVDAIVPLGTRA